MKAEKERRVALGGLAIASTLLLAMSGSATAVVSIETNATAEGFAEGFPNPGYVSTGIFAQDPQSGPPPSVLLSRVEDPEGASDSNFGDPAFAVATQNDSGAGAVQAQGLWAGGSNDYTTLSASASFQDMVTNSSGGARDYTYDFSIEAPQLKIFDFAGVSDADFQAMRATYEIVITLDGNELFTSSAELVGGSVSHVLNEAGTSLNPVFFQLGFGGEFGYDFDSYSDTLALGQFDDGESFTVGYSLLVTAGGPQFETGAQALIGDPNDLGGLPGFAGVINSTAAGPGPGPGPDPVPSAGILLMLASGMLGLGAVRRFKRGC